MLLMFYRADVLEASRHGVPSSWEDLLQVATALNGTDLDGDGNRDYGVCISTTPGAPALTCCKDMRCPVQSRWVLGVLKAAEAAKTSCENSDCAGSACAVRQLLVLAAHKTTNPPFILANDATGRPCILR